MKFTKYILVTILFIIVNCCVFSSTTNIPANIPSFEANAGCKSEGQKIPNPKFENKLFLCHFYAPSETWLLFPFHCKIKEHVFDEIAAKCINKFNRKALIFPFVHQNYRLHQFQQIDLNTEIPDPEFTYSSLNPAFSSVEGIKQRTNIEESSKCMDCRAIMNTLTSTINKLSLTITRMSDFRSKERNNIPNIPLNNSINIIFPNVGSPLPIQQLDLKQNYTKFAQIENHRKPSIVDTSKTFSSVVTTPNSIAPTSSHSRTDNATTTTAKPFLKSPLVANYHGNMVEHKRPLQQTLHKTTNSPFQNAGNDFMDFIFKNILRPIQNPPYSFPTFGSNRNPPNTPISFFKPLPFRPKPVLTQRITGPTRSGLNNQPFLLRKPPTLPQPVEKPGNGGAFINLLSTLHSLDEKLSSAMADSEEDGDFDEEDDLIFTYRSTPKPQPPENATMKNAHNSNFGSNATIATTIATSTLNNSETDTSLHQDTSISADSLTSNSTVTSIEMSTTTNTPPITLVTETISLSTDNSQIPSNQSLVPTSVTHQIKDEHQIDQDDIHDDESEDQHEDSFFLNNRKPRKKTKV